MARFHKNGILILKNKKGQYCVFESHSTLSEVAKYIWKDESFSNYYVMPDEKEDKTREVFFIDLKKEIPQRLRNFNELIDDNFYGDV